MTGVFPISVEPVSTPYPPDSLTSAYTELITGQGQGQYLIEIDAYIGGEARSGGGVDPVATLPIADISEGGAVSVGLATVRLADIQWVGYPTDTIMPNIYYEGRVLVPLIMERNMPAAPEDPRRVQRQFGQIIIANGDAALDTITQFYAVDGRRVRVLFGPYMGAYADFSTIFDGLGTGWEGDEDTVRLNLRDQTYGLDTPLQTNLYLGTGAEEGTAENAGKPKPLLFGRARNVTPVLIDPVPLIYQWHDGISFALDQVWERGLPLTMSGMDYADHAALAAAIIGPSNVATCMAESKFRLGSQPAGLITCDARGDVLDGEYIDTYDLIAKRLLLRRAGIQPQFVNAGSFASAAAGGSGEMGFYVAPDQTPSTAQVMDTLAAAIDAWWGAGRDGRVRAGRLVDPAPRSPNLTLDQFDVLTVVPEAPPTPRWRQRVGYQPNWTIQRGEDLSAVVDADRKQFLADPMRVEPFEDGAVKLRHLQALDPVPLNGLFENKADATSLATLLHGLHSVDRRIFSVSVKRLGFLVYLGQFVHLTYPKFGLSSGQKFVVIGIREDADQDMTVLRLWG